MNLKPFTSPENARGAVLFVALIFLVLLTLLALGASNTATLQERMVGGLRNGQMAQYGAESALREAESRLWSAAATNKPFVVCGDTAAFGCYNFRPSGPNSTVENFRNTKMMTDVGAMTFASADLTAVDQPSARLATNPAYLIEDLGVQRPPGSGSAAESGYTGKGAGAAYADKHVYRITARSTGGSDTSVRASVSTFVAKSN